MSASRPLVVAAAAALGCAALTACGGPASPGGPGVPTASSAAPGAPTASGAPGAVDACRLLTASRAREVLHGPLGTGRHTSSGQLSECVYDRAGPLTVAVLRTSDGPHTFRALIRAQALGSYAKRSGKAKEVPGLGDQAYAYPGAGTVEVLRGSNVLSVTCPRLSTSEAVAEAVLPELR